MFFTLVVLHCYGATAKEKIEVYTEVINNAIITSATYWIHTQNAAFIWKSSHVTMAYLDENLIQ